MKLNEFIQRNIGCKVDYDGVWGAQCVDLFRQYCRDVLEIPRTESVEGAKDLMIRYDSMPIEKKYFVAMKTRNARYGDVLVYGSTKTNKWGHVAIMVANVNDNVDLVFEQDGFKQDGAKLVERANDNVIGILRYRGTK